MHSCHPSSAGPAIRRFALCALWVLCLSARFGASARIPTVPPTFTVSPVNTTVYVGQTATLNAGVDDVSATFQWQFGGTNLPGATLPALVLPNATTNLAGLYQVIAGNLGGATTSGPVTLTVLDLPTGTLSLGNYVFAGSPLVPVNYLARGNETEVDFSIAFNVLTLKNPRFISDLPAAVGESVLPTRVAHTAEAGGNGATVVEDSSQAANGLFGVKLLFGTNFRLDPGQRMVGTVAFDLVEGARPMAAGLGLTNVPVAPVGPVIDATNAIVTLGPVGPLIIPGAAPKLDFQSGLFVQRFSVGNPGTTSNAFVRISVGGLGLDSLGLAMLAWNSYGTSSVTALPTLAITNLFPGDTKTLAAEFYVADLATVPTPIYTVDATSVSVDPVLSTRIIAVDRALYFHNASYPAGALLVEFPTDVGRSYYVEYADTLADLNAAGPTLRVARPSIPGTGSRVQWIDSGPPKTEAVPADGARFYRVIPSR